MRMVRALLRRGRTRLLAAAPVVADRRCNQLCAAAQIEVRRKQIVETKRAFRRQRERRQSDLLLRPGIKSASYALACAVACSRTDLKMSSLRIQLSIPVQVVDPAIVQVVRREQPAVAVQLVHGGENAVCRGNMRACWVVISALRRLQGEQAATTFSQVVWPPFERGMM